MQEMSYIQSMHRYQAMLKNIWSICEDILFPKVCIHCKETGEVLCEKCLRSTLRCSHQPSHAYALFSYRDPIIKKAIYSLKYKNNKTIAHVFARELYNTLLEDMAEEVMFHSSTKPTLVPIPLHPIRKRQRGYNQSELICKELSFIDQTIFEYRNDVLYRTRNTPSQTHTTSKQARKDNIKDCFNVPSGVDLTNRTIILIDDISTTGATLGEATKALKRAGASRVYSYVIAH
jgi:competence protein ComFC